MNKQDTPTVEQIQAALDRSLVVYGQVLEMLEKENDPASVLQGLWINLTRHLAEAGWTPEQLAEQAAWHAAHETSEGSA